MLAFVTTLRHPSTAFSWNRVCTLLERTLYSVCQQTAPEFRIIVVCNERPSIGFQHPAIEYLVVNRPPPANGPDDLALNMDAILKDRGYKNLDALYHLREQPPRYVMFFDSDDLLSRHLTRYLNDAPEADVFLSEKGYGHCYGQRIVFRYRRNFHQFCGTCQIFRYEKFELPSRQEETSWNYVRSMLADHNGVAAQLAKKGWRLQTLPFPAAVYMVGTGENHSAMNSFSTLIRRSRGGILSRAAAIRQFRFLSPQLVHDFGLPLEDAPVISGFAKFPARSRPLHE